jgi:D-glucuronyl C5-epimerase C-terminus
VWEYYPGQGIELQVLGNFGKADALYAAGPAEYPQLESLLAQMIPLAVSRAGGLTWEYYFDYDGGAPPWTSAMSQATGLEALSRAFLATGNRYYLALAHSALAIFSTPPPVGVDIKTALGSRYLQYSFAPDTAILNAFLQTLIGLYDYAQVSGDPQAAGLFGAGDAEARAEVPSYDTGAWSLYQPGVEDSLSYHTLVTGFLAQLCQLTAAPVYCTTAGHFQAYLKTPPALSWLSPTARVGKPVRVRFHLSKYSHVGIVVVHGLRTTFLTSAYFAYGVDSFSIPRLTRPGLYTIRLAATDLAGNFNRITATITASR